MENKHNTNDITNKQHYRCLTEADFYPPSDDRTLKSNIVDINGMIKPGVQPWLHARIFHGP